MQQIAILGDSFTCGNIYGVQRFAYEIIRQVDVCNPDLEIVVIVPQNAKVQIEFDNIKLVRYGKIRNAFLWRQICFPQYLKHYQALGIDLTLGLPFLKCDIVCLHDCIYENYGKSFQTLKEKLKRASYLFKVRHLVKTSKHILTVSNNSKNELVNYYKVAQDKITVIYNAWQHYERIISDETIFTSLGIDINTEYYFALGSGLRHKNLAWIIKAAEQNQDILFIVTGDNTLSKYTDDIGLKNVKNICFTGYIKDEYVKALMQHAKAFIHPSFYEGFGIPPLEALACGCEIVISNTSCLPEIYGDCARYIDPYNYDINMRSIMEQHHTNPRAVLQKYNWSISAQHLIKVIYEVMSR